MGCRGSRVEELVLKLTNCRRGLIRWSKDNFPNARLMVDKLTARLKECNAGILD